MMKKYLPIILLTFITTLASAQTDEEVIFIEVQTGSYFGEDDIIRIEDDYKRTD